MPGRPVPRDRPEVLDAERDQPDRQPRLALDQPADDPEHARGRQPGRDALEVAPLHRAGPAKHQAVKRLRPTCIAANASAKVSPRAPKASGIDIDMKSPSSIEA